MGNDFYPVTGFLYEIASYRITCEALLIRGYVGIDYDLKMNWVVLYLLLNFVVLCSYKNSQRYLVVNSFDFEYNMDREGLNYN